MHIRCLVLSIAFVLGLNGVEASAGNCRRQPDRKYWVGQLVRIAGPVYENLSRNTLRRNMPVETNGGYDVPGNNRKEVTHLEALGRSFCGIAPWLNLGPDDTPEGKVRARMIDLVVKGISNAVDPESPD